MKQLAILLMIGLFGCATYSRESVNVFGFDNQKQIVLGEFVCVGGNRIRIDLVDPLQKADKDYFVNSLLNNTVMDHYYYGGRIFFCTISRNDSDKIVVLKRYFIEK